MSEKFPSSEKLKSKILIDRLFAEGRSLKKYPVKLIYIPVAKPEITTHQTGVSVPKRIFKKAVDRNYFKRLMREAFRKNKYLVDNNLDKNFALMFIYSAPQRLEYKEVLSAMTWLMEKLIEKEGRK
ncbi:ribonuclease P protein component [soil metagenome]